ncbi:patatin-like phospholipase family protein [Leptospira noguchii]|uniref:patatin-like phospholipase family protein n=1 Tax=Leptospira noguchii TaxID=28182 RepID=UPI0011475140|nr:patatin-like phospholipase family protein [Leptospira noguchii]TQE73538.1 alpha/beta hydrolase [Leptospira noguchii]UOG30015.1 patatin-like phospholipase family protein [Leptospira noguchii]UOG52197.1 patatin-like phospholipase family protein [Leptospira noguchii]
MQFHVKQKFTALTFNSAFFGFYAHAGFAKGLSEIGFYPSKITGCSSGALIGSLVAAGIPIDTITNLILNLKKKDFWEGNLVTNFVKPIRKGLKNYSGILSGKKVKELLKPHLGNKKIEELSIPMGISVSNITKQIRELKTKGDLVDQILASMTFPFLFEIQKLGEEEFIDGGVADQEPIKELILDKSVRKIVIHSVLTKKDHSEKAMIRAFHSSVQIIENETRELKELLAKHYKKQILRVETLTPYIDANQLRHGKEAMEEGRKSAHRWKKKILSNV